MSDLLYIGIMCFTYLIMTPCGWNLYSCTLQEDCMVIEVQIIVVES